jgi:DNA repair exonuclease SbcCD ATPase subunit
MNVKEYFINNIIIVIAIITAYAIFADHRRESVGAGELTRQLDSLDREHRERQRNLETRLRELANLSENAISSLDGAGEIVERTGRELQSAAENLRDAKKILGNLAVQIKDLQSDLDDCRADLRRIRSLSGMESGGEIAPE